jgi:hypothetical protein
MSWIVIYLPNYNLEISMKKLLSVLVAGIFAAVTFAAVAADEAMAPAKAAPAAKTEAKAGKTTKHAKKHTKHTKHSKKAADATKS